MRFSFWMNNRDPIAESLRSGLRAEKMGWDGLWFADHFLPFMAADDGPVNEVWGVLCALGQATSKIRLGPLVCGNTYRNPAILAKQAVTADHISGGRIVLGLGAGWQENEHTAFGLQFGTFTERFERMEEALQILRQLRDQDRANLDGKHYQVVDAPLSPKPMGPLPIMIGGGGEKKTLRMVAQYAEEWNVWSTPETMVSKATVLGRHCETVGRDSKEIKRSSVALLFLCDTEAESKKRREKPMEQASLIGTASELREQMQAYVEAGVDELIIPDFTLGEGSKKDDLLDRFLSEVAAPFR